MATHSPFFLRHDETLSATRRVFGVPHFSPIGVILVNIMIYVALLTATLLTVCFCLQVVGVIA